MDKKPNPWAPESGNLAGMKGWYPAARGLSPSSSDQSGQGTDAPDADLQAHAPPPPSSDPVTPSPTQSVQGRGRRPTTASSDLRSSELDLEELQAIVGAGTSFTGTLSFAGRVRIDGEFSGQLLGGRLVVIGQGARVQGRVEAARVVILGGVVKADVIAREGIELYVPAQVSGDLQAPEIHLDRGVRFQGTCDLSDPALDR